MKKIAKLIPNLHTSYVFPEDLPLDKILFMDIETTGFTARSSYLYLIGCIFHREDGFHLIQFFAENYEEEELILRAFIEFSSHFDTLIHFNGNHFDLPYLKEKAKMLEMDFSLDSKKGIDIYKRILPMKQFLKLNNLKQKSIEAFLGIDREDMYNGGELISVYHDYVKEPTEYALNLLLLHNEEDMAGMVQILPILSYSDLLTGSAKAVKVNANYYTGVDGTEQAELVMSLKTKNPLPKHVTCYEKGCYFVGEENSLTLKVPIYQEELKYFYSDYKSYYYLPLEDVALHKSVASFVDKDHRENAKASNCYTRKKSEYLEQFTPEFEPIFKRSYEDAKTFFELTDEFKQDRAGFAKYANSVLLMMVNSKSS